MSTPYWSRSHAGGAATPWALVHGFLGGPAQWDEVCAARAPGPVWRATVPGHGVPPATLPAGGWQGAMRALWDALPVEGPLCLAGYSLGARVVLGMAAARPERCERVVLVGGDPGLESEPARAQRRAMEQCWSAELREQGLERFVAQWESMPLFATQRLLEERLQQKQRAQRRAHDPEALAAALGALGLGAMPALGATLRALGARVTLLTGALDEKFTELARGYSDVCGHRVVPGVGHNVLLEAPRAVAQSMDWQVHDER